MRDGGGRGEARPGPERRPTLADHLVSDISTSTICIQCVGVEWGRIN